MSHPDLLKVDDVSLSFAGVKALTQVNLQVPASSLAAVIGPNGAGKTSLFNCICRVYKPNAGKITFNGDRIDHRPPHEVASLGIARMFQNLALFEHMTVLENMLLGCHHLYRSRWWHDVLWLKRTRNEEIRHRKHAEDIIDFLNLERYRKSYVGVLPYGVLKRVELGRALCMRPQLLLLDEPAAGLNQEETEDMARYILDIKEDLSIAQILIEHDLRFVLDLADTITVLDFGKVIASGTPDAVKKDPAVVEAYVGGGGAP